MVHHTIGLIYKYNHCMPGKHAHQPPPHTQHVHRGRQPSGQPHRPAPGAGPSPPHPHPPRAHGPPPRRTGTAATPRRHGRRTGRRSRHGRKQHTSRSGPRTWRGAGAGAPPPTGIGPAAGPAATAAAPRCRARRAPRRHQPHAARRTPLRPRGTGTGALTHALAAAPVSAGGGRGMAAAPGVPFFS